MCQETFIFLKEPLECLQGGGDNVSTQSYLFIPQVEGEAKEEFGELCFMRDMDDFHKYWKNKCGERKVPNSREDVFDWLEDFL